MSGTQDVQGRRGEATLFHPDDRIIQVVDVTWADATDDAGVHVCEWRWYRDGQLISDSHERRVAFFRTPTVLHAMRPAAPLGLGHFTVETLVDGKVIATSAFTIAA